MVSAYRLSGVAKFEGSCQPLAALQSPYRQRRLSGSSPCLTQIALSRLSVFPKSAALPNAITPVSHWLAPEGAKPVECIRLRQVETKDSVALGSWSVVSRRSSARRLRPAAAFIAAASPGAAAAKWEASSPRAVLAPTHPSTGRCAIKPRSAGYVKRWTSQASL